MGADFTLSIDAAFRGHVKVKKFARLMGDPRLGFGYLIAFWGWAADSAKDGDLTNIDIPEIEDGAGYPEANGICYSALVASGFIDAHPDGRREIHNWMKPGRTGHAIKQLEAARERWRTSKGIKRRATDVPAETTMEHAGTSAGHPVDISAVPAPSRFTVHGSIPDPPPVLSVSEPGAPARSNGDASHPRRIEPTTPHDLEHVLRVNVQDRHPEVFPWVPGPFSAKDLREFFDQLAASGAGPAAPGIVRERIESYAVMDDDEVVKAGWSVKLFLKRFSGIGARASPRRTAPPAYTGHEPA